MAEQLYLAVETRCDINQAQNGAPSDTDNNTVLEMENEQAKQWLRQSTVSISLVVCVARVRNGEGAGKSASARSETDLFPLLFQRLLGVRYWRPFDLNKLRNEV